MEIDGKYCKGINSWLKNSLYFLIIDDARKVGVLIIAIGRLNKKQDKKY